MDDMEYNNRLYGEQPEPPPYIPKHEKEPSETASDGKAEEAAGQPDETEERQNAAETGRQEYDSFMYEPIGFEELERQQIPFTYDAGSPAKPRRTRSEAAALVLFALLTAASLVIAVFGIVKDVSDSNTAIDKIVNSRQLVIYRGTKPEGANDPENFVDENGKYTVEGAAAATIDSVVSVYVYADSAHAQPLGSGSGIILTEDGYIVTNAHVIQANGYHTVTTSDDKVYDAKIIGRDTKTDIAVLKINGAELTPAVLGDSDETIVGEQVIAVGNPSSLPNTVTAGIVSYIGREMRVDSSSFKMNYIQTNADVSPGNSGGALVNMYGQVIGINTFKVTGSNLEGLNFAITINDALPIIEELVDKGYVGGRFRIGIQLIDMSTWSNKLMIEELLGYELPEGFAGIYVDSISDDSDIINTRLQPGDFIMSINGKSVHTYEGFYDSISQNYGPGDTVPATCAHVSEDGSVEYYSIDFKLLEDTSGDY